MIVFNGSQNTKIVSMTAIIDIFQFHCKNEHKRKREIKSHVKCANLTVFILIYKVVHYLIDFGNLFFDEVYLKNE